MVCRKWMQYTINQIAIIMHGTPKKERPIKGARLLLYAIAVYG